MAKLEQENLNSPEDNLEETPEQKEISDALKEIPESIEVAKPEEVPESPESSAQEFKEARENIEKAYAPEAETEGEENSNEEGLEAQKDKIRDALKTVLTEQKDVSSVVRHTLVRPFRTMMQGGIRAMDEKMDASADVISDFCKKVEMPYPQNQQEVEKLLEKLDSAEFDEKIKSAPAEQPQG